MSRLNARARATAAIAAGVLAVAAVVAAFAVAQDASERRHAAAVADHAAAVAAVDAGRADLDAAEEEATAAATLAGPLGDLPEGYADAEDRAGLTDALAAIAVELAAADALPDVEPAGAPDRDGPFGGLDADARRLDAETARLRERATGFEDAAAGLESAAVRVDEAATALVEGIPPAAAALEAQHESARNLDRLAFRDAAAVVDAADGWDGGVADAVGAYVAAADAFVASHDAEEAEKAGPLYDRRKEVEAFARELANGVLLEFDWAPTVQGYGSDGTYGGSATWDVTGGGISTIAFSDSVAGLWDAPGVRALVVHEVGHAMTAKCLGTIVPDELAYGDNEAWATAWAISMGYTGDGSGEWVYGRPADDVIELAARCR